MGKRAPERRRELLIQLSAARTESEIYEAEEETRRYLDLNPHDMNVAVAAENLEGRAARVRNPERRANRWSVAVFVGLITLITLVVFGYTRAVVPSVLIAVPIAGLIAEWVWEMLKTRAELKGARCETSGSG